MNEQELARTPRYRTYIRLTARRRPGVELQPYCWPDGSFTLPHAFESKGIAASHKNPRNSGKLS